MKNEYLELLLKEKKKLEKEIDKNRTDENFGRLIQVIAEIKLENRGVF